MSPMVRYFDELTLAIGAAWNRFWFTPADPAMVSLLRLLVGSMACWFLLGFSGDLTIWFGADGLLPIEMAQQLAEDTSGSWNGRASYLFLSDDTRWLAVTHVVGSLVAIAFTAGFFTRISGMVTYLVVLSYIHRGPILMGQFEPVLSWLLFYLCFAPCDRRFSLDRWIAKRRGSATRRIYFENAEPSVAANVSQRLIQVHIAAFYLMIGCTKLAGVDWWNGEAMWWLIAHTESRLVDLSFLHGHEYVINMWTHAVVLFEVSFGILIWLRLARPLLLTLGCLHWVLLGLVTGLLSYGAIMLIANLSFVSASAVANVFSPQATGLGAKSDAPVAT